MSKVFLIITAFVLFISCNRNSNHINKKHELSSNLQDSDVTISNLKTPKEYGRYLFTALKNNDKAAFKNLLIDTNYLYLFNDMRNPYYLFDQLITNWDINWSETKYSKTRESDRFGTKIIEVYFIDKRNYRQFYIEFSLNKDSATGKYHIDPFQKWEMNYDRAVAKD